MYIYDNHELLNCLMHTKYKQLEKKRKNALFVYMLITYIVLTKVIKVRCWG